MDVTACFTKGEKFWREKSGSLEATFVSNGDNPGLKDSTTAGIQNYEWTTQCTPNYLAGSASKLLLDSFVYDSFV